MPDTDIEIMIRPDGSIAFIHNDSVTESLKDLGKLAIKRASNVEPTNTGQWNVDMTPVGGPENLGTTYEKRADALASEVVFLKNNFPQSVEKLFSE